MKKIIGSLLAIVLTVSLVAGGAYALFSDTVQVQGIQITSGSAVLKVQKTSEGPSAWHDDITFSNSQWAEKLYPGYEDPNPIRFRLKNQSTANIDLKVSAKLVGGTTGDAWDALKNVVFVRFTNVYASPSEPPTEWISLNRWKNAGGELPQLLSPVDDDDEFTMEVMMDKNAGNTAAGQLLQDLVFEFTGTQVVQ